ncbi:MAG: aminotransferase class I/II-fold pyridoxal phosphate-dependent enzyme [Gemmatimonadetes bacterium]|nr:aminotransferase class I/II-fold pyridoxal phosphate-dependent enzyme [Gemmatimonadota bacterium]MDA1103850.1 aminotransferase class I/II-fold pyridoxal phosphate-dependent enzyme [Gemmatimonadota bacterium]
MTNRADRTALRTHSFTESVIREMTRVARQHDAVNLAQGFPDFPAPELLKDAACAAIQNDVNQYAITWGAPNLRNALSRKYGEHYGMEVDPERELTVTCGGTEAMAAVMLAIVNPGDEVIVMEPFYENYGPDAVLCQAKPIFLTLVAPDYRLDKAALEAAVTPKTRAIVINTPNNPTGRVFDRAELQAIADVCIEHDIIAITDEIYEHIYYEGEHIPLATFDGMRDRTITVSGLSKTFSVTGWRVGTIVAPADLSHAIRKVHDFLTVGAPAPLQEACAVGLNQLGPEYYSDMVAGYKERGAVLVAALQEAGFKCQHPQGAYYVLADFSDLSDEDSMTFGRRLAAEGGVAPVPGASFFSVPERGHSLVRFVFCKRLETLREAGERLRAFAARG